MQEAALAASFVFSMVTTGRIVKNTTYLTAGIILQKVLAFVFFTLIARLTGVEHLGKYTYALSYTTLFSTFIDTGLTPVLIREVAKAPHHARKYLGNMLSVKALLSILLYIVVIVSSNILGHDQLTHQLLMIAGFIMILDSFSLSFFGVFRALQNVRIEAIGTIGSQTVVLILGTIALFMHWPLHALVGAVLGGSVFYFCLGLWQLMRSDLSPRFEWDRAFLRTTFIMAIPFALSGIFTRLYGNIDTLLLGHLKGDAAVGLYSVANKFAFSLQFVPMAFIAAIYPAMSHYYTHSKEKLRVTFEGSLLILALFGVVVSFGVFSIAPEVIHLFYGSAYEPSILSLQILVFSLMFIFMQFPVGSLLNACNRQTLNTVLMGITAVINVVMNLVLIPRYEQNGAAVAFLVSYAFLFVSGFIATRRMVEFSFAKLVWRLFKLIIASAAMSVAVFAVKPFLPLAGIIAVGAVAYVAALFVIRALTMDEVKRIWELMHRKEEAVALPEEV